MTRLADNKTVVAAIAGLSLVGALAGCAPTEVESTPAETTEPSTEATTAPEDTTEEAASTYVDGTYTESGTYQSPNGTESVDVTVTLADDIITAVEVVGEATAPNSVRYQGEFISGISAIVVGQDIDSISVSKVAGSSLTSGGFNAAIEQIKVDAAS